MAPAPDQLSSPGSVSYDSDTMVVGDGTWDFTKNTFLLPNLQGTDFDTMRYNGMGNRFSTLHQYHTIILAHGILATMVFLFLVPFSVMLIRFYTREPIHTIRHHARLQVFSLLLLTAAFILPFFAVGPKRALSNPHHGIGVAIYVMFVVQLVGGRIIQHITKMRSLRIMLHQWLGRAIAILGIVQIPLGLTLYGSPKVLFILYAVWMGFLLLVYFVLSYQAEGRRDHYISGGRSEAGTRITGITESEYYSEHRDEHHSKLKWLGPLAAAAGVFALARGRKNHDDDRSRVRSRSPSMSRSRGPTVISSRPSYFSEKYSDVPERSGGGGGMLKALGGAAAVFGAGKLFSNFMSRRDRRDEEYSAVSTETPRRNRSGRAMTVSEYASEYTDDASTIPPSRAPAPTQTASAFGARDSGRRSSLPPSRSDIRGNARGYDDSDYSSYVSPSRRRDEPSGGGGGFAKGVLATLGVGWLAKKFADRRARKEEDDRFRDEEEMRSGTQFSRYSQTNTEYTSPIRRDSRRPPQRRSTVTGTELSSDMTESTFDTQTELSRPPQKAPRGERLSMPSMPSDPHGVLHRSEVSDVTSLADRPTGRNQSRRQMDSERAAAEAAARASNLAAKERGRFGSSSTSQPSGARSRVQDKDRNVTLRKLTEEESLGRRYRRDDSQRRAESAAESRAESRVQDDSSRVGPLPPPNPSYAKDRRGRDSAYYSGQPAQAGPSGHLAPPGMQLPNASVSSIGSHGTWSGMGPPTEVPSGPAAVPPVVPPVVPSTAPPTEIKEDKGNESAADNRRRRRAERRRASSSHPPPSGTDTYTTDTYDDTERGY
ncbi:hypothetical protein T069G_06596 [Trichoderma breve]|uniref:Cytochrome b561 domain-containing protein n=1 Tax=Trichoderma breve TaxID=2034170 RepID=A0A9W9B9A5_9HYPO|nr:hypothetical protein T069G_06596 [Trichoderma breve]KAJ4858329.1 hypothetical protein T069G_06596 [Trichoderma breve]